MLVSPNVVKIPFPEEVLFSMVIKIKQDRKKHKHEIKANAQDRQKVAYLFQKYRFRSHRQRIARKPPRPPR